MLAASRAGGGLLTGEDVAAYRARLRDAAGVIAREAARVDQPAALGGRIDRARRAGAAFPGHRAAARRAAHCWAGVAEALADATLQRRGPGQVSTGTTHVSVIDAAGRDRGLTTSNGSGSGTVVPGWGVPLNNMLGEEDLHPGDRSANWPRAPGWGR